MKHIRLLPILLAAIVLLVGCKQDRSYSFLHDSGEISAVYLVMKDEKEEKSIPATLEMLTEIPALNWTYIAPPNPYLTDPYIRVIYKNSDEEWISEQCAYWISDGQAKMQSGVFEKEDFRRIIAPYLNESEP